MYAEQSQEFSFANSKGGNFKLTLQPTGILINKKKDRFIETRLVLGVREYYLKEEKLLKIEMLFLEKTTNKQGQKCYVSVLIELLSEDEAYLRDFY